MNAERPAWEQLSGAGVLSPVQPRKLAKVPFVEMAEGRLQGVVSSGSDIERVYVSSITAGTHGYNCSTNNNRPCGGLRGAPCKHLQSLVDEAVIQYGLERVARYLRVEGDSAASLVRNLSGGHESIPAAVVFSRFLRHLAYLELPGTSEPVAEMHWFPSLGAVG
ncbi:hypothetical protein Pth03_38790 [Planotetraspora thailandica]|uniref:Uncharacterized protein n=1 Tax=Planotetraspora thailandica TaxID=487172 RepID=A0A8J3XX05_9ACTN|nr:hypothetical protein [Planotetraspora thailandica]GII55490.1 hypothetical protein Pth03_38790 [Planotetraspora thailandica]